MLQVQHKMVMKSWKSLASYEGSNELLIYIISSYKQDGDCCDGNNNTLVVMVDSDSLGRLASCL
jgi:hypothetical protein